MMFYFLKNYQHYLCYIHLWLTINTHLLLYLDKATVLGESYHVLVLLLYLSTTS